LPNTYLYKVVVTQCASLDTLHLTERGLQVRSSAPSAVGGDAEREISGVGGGQENDLVVELGGEWTVGLTPEEWSALAASLAAHRPTQMVLLR
jgi:hypothetical protein